MSVWDVSPKGSGLPNLPREDKFLPEERPADGTVGITPIQEDDISTTENVKKTIFKNGSIITYDENGLDRAWFGILPDGTIGFLISKEGESVLEQIE